MASLTLRNLDEGVKNRLRVRAAEHGRSMEDEARRILREALDWEPPRTLADLALEIFGEDHGAVIEPHPPVEIRDLPRFELE